MRVAKRVKMMMIMIMSIIILWNWDCCCSGFDRKRALEDQSFPHFQHQHQHHANHRHRPPLNIFQCIITPSMSPPCFRRLDVRKPFTFPSWSVGFPGMPIPVRNSQYCTTFILVIITNHKEATLTTTIVICLVDRDPIFFCLTLQAALV